MKILITKLTVLFLLFASVSFAAGPYFIKNGGNDSLDGLSDATAWETLNKPRTMSLAASSDIYLKVGSVWLEEKLTVNWSGTSEDWVVIGAYEGNGDLILEGDETRPIINGNQIYPTSINEGLIHGNHQNYIIVQDLDLRNSYGAGVYLNNSSYTITQRNNIAWTWNQAVLVYTGDHATVEYNTISESAMKRPSTGMWPASIALRFAPYSVVRYNSLTSIHGEGIGIGSYGVVMYNKLINTRSVAIYVHGIHDTEVAYNLVYGTNDTTYTIVTGWHGPGIAIGTENNYSTVDNCYDNKIHHNIIINTYAGIRMYESNDAKEDYQIYNQYIYNNLFIDNYGNFFLANVADDIDVSTIYVKNNMSYSPSTESEHSRVSDYALNNWTCSNNMWSIGTAPSNALSGAGDQTGDPGLPKTTWRGSTTLNNGTFTMADLVPYLGSDALDHGTDLGVDYNTALGQETEMQPSDAMTFVTIGDQGLTDIGVFELLEKIYGVNPPNDGTGMAISGKWTWSNPGCDSLTIYYEEGDSTPDVEVSSGTLPTEYDPAGDMTVSSENYMQADCVMGAVTITGDVYHITTAGGPPQVAGTSGKNLSSPLGMRVLSHPSGMRKR